MSLANLLQASHAFLHNAQGAPTITINGVAYNCTLGTQNQSAPVQFGGPAEAIETTAIISKSDLTTEPAIGALASNENENIRYRIMEIREPAGAGVYEIDLGRDAREYYLEMGNGHKLLLGSNDAKLAL